MVGRAAAHPAMRLRPPMRHGRPRWHLLGGWPPAKTRLRPCRPAGAQGREPKPQHHAARVLGVEEPVRRADLGFRTRGRDKLRRRGSLRPSPPEEFGVLFVERTRGASERHRRGAASRTAFRTRTPAIEKAQCVLDCGNGSHCHVGGHCSSLRRDFEALATAVHQLDH